MAGYLGGSGAGDGELEDAVGLFRQENPYGCSGPVVLVNGECVEVRWFWRSKVGVLDPPVVGFAS